MVPRKLAGTSVSSRKSKQKRANALDSPKLTAMGAAYSALLEDERWLRMQLQMYAACGDDVIRVRARDLYRELVDTVRELSGADEEELWRFFAAGMLINVISSIGLREIADVDEWAARWCDPSSMRH